MTRPARTAFAGRRVCGRVTDDQIHDTYEVQHKPHDPTVCDVVYHRGRWQRSAAPEEAHHARCPACRRIDEALPAGIVTLHGELARSRKADIVKLAQSEEEVETSEHPLNRIIDISEVDDGVEISTTDIHLPRRLAAALQRAYGGELDIHFDKARYFVRVHWRR